MFPRCVWRKITELRLKREQCIKLLKAMLKTDGDERITPYEVFTHPFITKDYLK